LVAGFAIGLMFGVTERGSVWEAIAVAPIFLWELSLGLWMTFKGFRADAPILSAAHADSVGARTHCSASPQPAPAPKAGAA